MSYSFNICITRPDYSSDTELGNGTTLVKITVQTLYGAHSRDAWMSWGPEGDSLGEVM